jgi:2,3-bisphosphoglycerate-independent phosphoglycerate mutase
MGNSEVGHLNIGAGRVVMQDLPRINRAAADGTLRDAVERSGLVAALRASGGTCHLLGLISPGGVHSHQDHAVALARVLADAGIPAVLHAFTDGRDTPPRAGAEYLHNLEAGLPRQVPLATVSGRYFAMDRDKRWERVAKAYAVLARAEGPRFASAQAVMQAAYVEDVTDEFVIPAAIGDYQGMRDGDALLSFNFRADRIREILAPLLDVEFSAFDRGRPPRLVKAVAMTSYSTDLDAKMAVLFPSQTLANGLGETVAKAGRTQVRMAETEKYPHVTYFLNGGEEVPYPGEDRIMVPSPKVATYDLQPEMSAPALTAKAVEAIRSGKYDVIVLNFANPDMVGHTGVLAAAIRAVETVDASLGQISAAIRGMGGSLIVTADHGNCEMMRDPETGGPHTAHTTNPVPIFLQTERRVTLADGRLADIAPTILALMGLEQPAEMTGKSLLRDA